MTGFVLRGGWFPFNKDNLRLYYRLVTYPKLVFYLISKLPLTFVLQELRGNISSMSVLLTGPVSRSGWTQWNCRWAREQCRVTIKCQSGPPYVLYLSKYILKYSEVLTYWFLKTLTVNKMKYNRSRSLKRLCSVSYWAGFFFLINIIRKQSQKQWHFWGPALFSCFPSWAGVLGSHPTRASVSSHLERSGPGYHQLLPAGPCLNSPPLKEVF